MNIRMHIERLVLEGIELPAAQIPGFRAAVETELSRMLAECGVHNSLRAGGAVPRLAGPDVKLDAQPNGSKLGRSVAHSVYGGLGK